MEVERQMKNIQKHRKGFRIAAASSHWMVLVLPVFAIAQGPAEPVVSTSSSAKSIISKPLAPAPQFKVEMQRQIELTPKSVDSAPDAPRNSSGLSQSKPNSGPQSTLPQSARATPQETPKAKVAAKFSMLKASGPKPISQVSSQNNVDESIVSPAMPPSLPVAAPEPAVQTPKQKTTLPTPPTIPAVVGEAKAAPGKYEMPLGINAFYEKLEGANRSEWMQPQAGASSIPLINKSDDAGTGRRYESSNDIGPVGIPTAVVDKTSPAELSGTGSTRSSSGPSSASPTTSPTTTVDGSVSVPLSGNTSPFESSVPGNPESNSTAIDGAIQTDVVPPAPPMFRPATEGSAVNAVPNNALESPSPVAGPVTTYPSGAYSDEALSNKTRNDAVVAPLESPTLQQQYAVPSFIPANPGEMPGGAIANATQPQDGTPKYGLQAPLPTRLPMVPWWQDYAQKPLLTRDRPNTSLYAELDQLVGMSLHYSPKIKSILIVPEIQRTEIGIAQADLDPRTFAQSIYHDTSDPVGNTLTTGGPKRLEDVFWENSVGARDKNSLGGKAEWTQLLNGRDSNSLFFQPNQQADTKLSINYTQPLLRGAGRSYNTASIRIAGLRTSSSIASANRELQNHVLDISNAYWELVLNRYLLAQAETGQNRLIQIYERLNGRIDADANRTQIHRAIAAIQTQQGSIGTLRGTIHSVQARLKALVNSPDLLGPECVEIIPSTMPADEYSVPDCSQEMMEALLSRGDILAIQNSIQAASVQKQMAINELRPQLDALTEVYVRGLRGNYNYGGAFVNQFDTGAVSYFAGLSYQRPVGNRAANNNLIGRRREMEKLISDYENAIVNARSDIMSAVAQSAGAFEALFAAINSTVSSSMEVEQIQADLDHVFTDKTSISNKLQDLLDAEGRLIQAENNWARNQIQYMKALTQIKYESGTLMAIMPEVQ